MNEKKNLDRLFQERFKDFEAEPSEQVWKNIESALKNKKKKKAIPLWYSLTGVAAALIIGLFVFNSVVDDGMNPENNVVIDNIQAPNNASEGIVNDNASKEKTEKERSSINPKKTDPEKMSGLESEKRTSTAVAEESKKQKIQKQSQGIINPENSVAVQKHKKNRLPKTKKTGVLSNDSENPIADSDNNNAVRKKRSTISRNDILDQRLKNSKNSNENGSESGIASSEKTKHSSEKLDTNISEKSTNPENQSRNTSIVSNLKNEQNNITNSTENQSKANNSIAYAEKTVDEKKLDSTAIATVEPNALEKLLAENEKEKKIAETKLNRWQLTSNVAPIYFGSASNGSPIDDQFSGNNKSYENNMSFGVGVNYAVSKKINVRAGINKLTLCYDTNNVIFYAGLGSQSFENISPSGNAAFIEIVSTDMASTLLPFENGLQNTKLGSINQTMGYIEVPMEMSYKLVDSKFGVTLIGGLSTLFLNENEIKITSSDVSSSLGKANNLNDIHFSSNIGLGFKYSILKDFDLHFEPMFKYQINTFTKQDGNFKPYFIGLYSGLSFRF